MPDWSYQTLFRPALFRLPSRIARDFTLNAMGALSRLPGGSLVIRTLGHMEPAPMLESKLAGVRITYPVGLSGSLDPRGVAHRAIAQFGIGFIEIGPVTLEPVESDRPIERDIEKEAIIYPPDPVNAGLEETVRRLKHKQGHSLPLMIRTSSRRGREWKEALQEQRQLMDALRPYAAAFYVDSLDERWTIEETVHHLEAMAQAEAGGGGRGGSGSRPMLLYIPLDYPQERLAELLKRVRMEHWAGLVIGERQMTEEGAVLGRAGKEPGLHKILLIRKLCGDEIPIVASGGVHEPQDALDLMQAGAQYVQLHSGLVYAGPGLPKRINEAVIYERFCDKEHGDLTESTEPSFWYNWGWMCLLGAGMIVGGILAWLIAASTVMLPYDVQFLGMDTLTIRQMNPLLLRFMSHDRVTLAGTMISIGILYFQFAYYGLRQGLHWVKTALMTSCIVGFSSFFLYLGYGYFDPLHALAGAVLLPMFILSMRGRADNPSVEPPNLYNDRLWKRAQWGQLMMVMLGFSLAIGGGVIAWIGITRVFVPEDLQYLCATPAMLNEINDRLIPLIAHDRAGFGGALFSDAIALLAAALWGVSQGRRWLWWTFLIGGFPGFLAGFSVHWAIGYTDFIHLLPAYFAAALYIAGLILLYPYLMHRRTDSRNQ
ncbi:hypothetical protein [Paenibacillus sp. OAS669]|uniref:hypothetical protein n=1 Tax=Paenibacillus sp. OAS669 TaxID=2663821 RepID=UPI0017896851|nr:hypothetical protein [Paenibacillus sp. OAS669]MBE1444656.1 dihydroorotate dehydrogenase [Paenibacillus sp. OAS669]